MDHSTRPPGSEAGTAAPYPPPNPITAWLARAPTGWFSLYAVAVAFTTYFCMYSYRKPFGAATYQGESFWILDLKTALVISQLVGYATSKFLGIKFNSEMPRHRRGKALLFLIGWAEAALVLFALVPAELKVLAIALNGLSLGMIWGLVFSYLEGRRTSEILGAGLSCAYIVASGAVKSVGSYVMTVYGVSEAWMPAATGLLFLPLFLFGVYGLELLPPPSREDAASRVSRAPMYRRERRAFSRRYFVGLAMLVVVYCFLTAFRDLRDNFAAEVFKEMGYGGAPAIFTLTELPIAFAVMLSLALLYLIKNNRLGLLGAFAIMTAGTALIGASTLLFDLGVIGPLSWMILIGTGAYLAYVPYGCVLFDRMIAALGVVATAVFLIYLTDAAGYAGAVGVTLYRDLGQPELNWVDFFRGFSYVTSAVSTVFFIASGVYFMRRAQHD